MLRTHRRCYGSERVKDRYRKKYTEPGQGSEDDGQKGQEGINREPSCKGRRGWSMARPEDNVYRREDAQGCVQQWKRVCYGWEGQSFISSRRPAEEMLKAIPQYPQSTKLKNTVSIPEASQDIDINTKPPSIQEIKMAITGMTKTKRLEQKAGALN